MHLPRRAAASDRAGFVLVGVLMFILVLTILGLTLFGLSSFESQFFTGSLAKRQAFDAATSAIERTQFVLARTGKLSDAGDLTGDLSGNPINGVVYVVAKQGTDYDTADSTGNVNWSPGARPVWIRSLAVVNGHRCLIEARFSPNGRDDIFRRLFTLSGTTEGLNVLPSILTPPPPTPVGPQVRLWGALSQLSLAALPFASAGIQPAPISVGDSLPTADVAGFLLAHPGGQVINPNSKDIYTLDASMLPDHIGFFATPFSLRDDSLSHVWSLNADGGNYPHDTNDDASITVHGTCIWMFDHGLRFFKKVQISGTTDDALIIIAGLGATSGGDAGAGIVFKSGLGTTDVPIVLVSNAGVALEHYENLGEGTDLRYLSVFAPWCFVVGPKLGSYMDLRHNPSAPEDQPGGLIDRLSQKGYLPNTTLATTGYFSPIAGTWREITSSDGTY